jgi:hypothetical protein
MRIRAITTLLLFVFLAMFSSRASAVSLEDGYLKYPKGGLMFKLPAGNWEIVKKVPTPYDAFSVGTKPDVVLAATIRPAVIKIWVERSSRDYSDNLIRAYGKLKGILKNRRKAARAAKQYKYFEYELFDGVPAAKSTMAAQVEDFQVQGQGEARIYFHKGKTYFQYIELLADSDVFDGVKEELSEALKETFGY